MTAKVLKLKEPKLDDLLDEQAYRNCFESLAHYSLKLTNSKVSGGFRLAGAEATGYLSASDEIAKGIDVERDYFSNAATEAKPFKHLNKARQVIREDDLDQDRYTKEKEIAHYAPVLKIFNSIAIKEGLVGIERLNARLPQLLIPKDDSYVSTTPLHSSGMAKYIHEVKRDNGISSRVIHHDVGGTQPQNVGGLVWYAQSVSLQSLPQEDPEIKEAYACYHRGPSIRFDIQKLKEYIEWKSGLALKAVSATSNRKLKDADTRWVLSLYRPIFKSFERSRMLLESKSHLFEGDELLSDSVAGYKQALFNYDKAHSSSLVGPVSKILEQMARVEVNGRSTGWHQSEVKSFAKAVVEEFYG